MFFVRNSIIVSVFAGCIGFGQSAPQSPVTAPPTTSQAPSTSAPNAAPAATTRRKSFLSKKKQPAAIDPCADQRHSDGSGQVDKDCPPPKIVVRHGGVSENTSHLAGANDPADVKQKQLTDQLLQTASHNLELLSSRQLGPAAKETLEQIRRYSEQSRAAIAAGDAETGHNLALKAQILSDELLNH